MKGNIYINGAIGTLIDEKGNIVEKGVELLDVILQVKNQPKATFFDVYINSPGGFVDVGWEIHDYLKGLGKPINTIGMGMVGSMATVIFLLGQKRELKPDAKFFIHLASGGIEGNSKEIDNYAKMIVDLEKKITKYYSEVTGMTNEALMPLLEKETSLTAEQAFKLGFSNVKPTVQQPIALFKPNKNQMSKTEKKSLWQQIQAIFKENGITNKTVFDAENKELDFYELADSDPVEVGAKANIDGVPADGEYKVPSEEDAEVVHTYRFVAGVLEEIIIPEEEVIEDADTEEVEAMKAKIAELETQLATEKEATASLTEQNKSYKKAIAKIRAIEAPAPEANPKPAPQRQPAPVVNKIGAAITNLKKKKENGL